MKDRGQELAIAAQRDPRKIEEIAKKAGYSRSAFYKHIKDPNLAYHILTDWGKALGIDFTILFPDMPKYMILQDPEVMLYAKPTNMDEANQLLDICREKYVRLIEDYNKMVRKMNDMLSPDGA
jgi:AcrR family transcriptional regulator